MAAFLFSSTSELSDYLIIQSFTKQMFKSFSKQNSNSHAFSS